MPVIVLTVRGSEEEKVRGLELGADDYVTKPFSPAELAARVRAVLRRVEAIHAPRLGLVVVDEHLQVNFDERLAIVAGRPVHLRPTEHRLLHLPVYHAGLTLPFSRILDEVRVPGTTTRCTTCTCTSPTCARRSSPSPPSHATSSRAVAWATSSARTVTPRQRMTIPVRPEGDGAGREQARGERLAVTTIA